MGPAAAEARSFAEGAGELVTSPAEPKAEAPETTWAELHPWRFRMDQLIGRLAERFWEAPCWVAMDPARCPHARVCESWEATDALLSALPERYRLLALLMRYAGLRFGEASGLRRRACDPARRHIRIEAVGDGYPGDAFQIIPRQFRRTYSVDDEVGGALAEHLARYVARGRKAFVFTDAQGKRLRRRDFEAQVWAPAVADARFPKELAPEDLTGCWMLENPEAPW